jgi:glycosyltransferase involved in cell wall biosynthesis
MKVLHLENIANIPFSICNMLRGAGVNCELFFSETAPHAHPLWDSEAISAKGNVVKSRKRRHRFDDYGDAQALPAWIHRKNSKKFMRFWFLSILMRTRCDLIHCYSKIGLEAAFLSGKPYIFQPMGVDAWYSRLSLEDTVVDAALRKARLVASYTYDVEARLNKRNIPFIRMNIPFDSNEMSPAKISRSFDKSTLDRLGFPKCGDGTVVILAPARLHWAMKGQDILLKYIKKANDVGLPVHVVFVEWGYDVEQTKGLVSKLGLEGRVSFVPFVSNRLLAYLMLNTTAVFDCLTYGGFGVIGRLALAMGRPLLDKAELNWEKYYSEQPPYLPIENERDFLQAVEAIRDENKSIQLGKKARNWIRNLLSFSAMAPKYLAMYERALNRF